ncbi:hypothetical protein MTR67_030217 [Solanum verrucosum]|uniref:Reverse transcriptase domain-containing protein n=1 Tax=Solanum verrucosum TaxID=315347 RepID=A0AAF0TXH6_SOLVR|nr:hypothetical protein MTR67_030217 [Solanum verrucosum]
MFEKSFNATFTALIPKKYGAEELKDFRPISLIGGVYKIIAKLLTERMKTVMGELVDEHQMAFLKGRRIMDAALLANELVDSRVKQKLVGVLCKLVIEKAYDHVNWSFLLKILRDMGFGNKWTNWIKTCISTGKFSLIINGSPEGFFQSQRGLRQGDPLSPFLFILAIKGLNSMIRRASENGWIRGFPANANRGNTMEITHLLYEDDSLVFCEAEVMQIRHLRAILTIFEGISGLHVNWHKSCLYLVNQVTNMQILAENLGCQMDSLPTKYLGMPLGAKNKEVEVWSEVLERSERKLTRWKSQYLSMGGRLTLIKSVMDTLPTYMMSLFPIPGNIEKKINKLRRVFLWQGNKEKLGYNLVKWDEVTLNKIQGGEEDRLVWKGERRGEFTIKSAYRELSSTEVQQAGWCWRMIWRTVMPYKVNYFTWLLAKEAVLTHENLNKRKSNLCSRCYLCEELVETVNHLFFTLQKDRSIVADVHPQEEDQVDKAWENYRSPTMLEQGWKCRKKGEEMEDCPSLHLVDNLEGKESKMFGRRGIKDVLKENKTIFRR